MIDKRPHLWCLFDRRTSRVIEGLLFDEARAFISNLDATEVENWFVWKEEWPDWRLAIEVEGLTEMIYRVLHVSPPPPPRGTEEQAVVDKIDQVKKPRPPALVSTSSFVPIETAVSNVPASETFPQQGGDSYSISPGEFVIRQQKRFKKRMAVTIVGSMNNQIYKTHTRDISVGGDVP